MVKFLYTSAYVVGYLGYSKVTTWIRQTAKCGHITKE
jgi:hypothetical protein